MWAKASEFLNDSREAVWLAQVGIAAAVAGVVWTLLQLLWLGLGWSAPLPEAIALPPVQEHRAPAASLGSWHLFGNSKLLTDPRALAQSAPTTTLAVTLTGVMASNNPRSGVAFIAADDGEPRKVRVGDEIQAGVLLDQVYPDRVILSRGGNLESLPLREAGSLDSSATTSAPRNPGAIAANGLPANNPGANFMAQVGQVQGPVVAAPVASANIDMEAVRKQYGVDPIQLAQAITPMPVLENGNFVGVRLHAGPQQAMLGKLGLRPDDIVTAVNGQSITDPSRIQGIVAGLQNANRVSLEIRRNGKTETLNLNVPR